MSDSLDPRAADPRPCPALLAPLTQHTTDDGAAQAALTQAVRAMLERGDESSVRDLLAWCGPSWCNRAVRRCVQSALDESAEAELRVQFFALPVVMVAAARAPLSLPMVLADAGALTGLFEAAGALGPSRQLAFSTSLCDEAALVDLSLVDLFRRVRLRGAAATLDLPPAPLDVGTTEGVALRFLVGSVLLARGAPGFTETAGDAAGWGGILTRELNAQLALPGVTLLPLARPPRGLLQALSLGRFCREEVASQLVLGGYLRELQARHGEASALLAGGPGEEITVTLRAAWSDEAFTHRWRLYPESDLGEVLDSIEGFLVACGVRRVERQRGAVRSGVQ